MPPMHIAATPRANRPPSSKMSVVGTPVEASPTRAGAAGDWSAGSRTICTAAAWSQVGLALNSCDHDVVPVSV